MMKRSGPTLYEAMSQSPAAPRATPGRRPRNPDSERPAAATLLTPGRSIRLPVGFAWVGVVLVAGLMIGAYLLGFSRGERAAEASAATVDAARLEAVQEAGRVREPVSAPPKPPAGGNWVRYHEPAPEDNKPMRNRGSQTHCQVVGVAQSRSLEQILPYVWISPNGEVYHMRPDCPSCRHRSPPVRFRRYRACGTCARSTEVEWVDTRRITRDFGRWAR